MGGTQYFGYLLIALSAALLAHHWLERLELGRRNKRRPDDDFRRSQLQRRSVASALIGVVGAAMTMVDRVPRTPRSLTMYLVGLLAGGAVILAIAVADLRAIRRRREGEHVDLVAAALRKASKRPGAADARRPESHRLIHRR